LKSYDFFPVVTVVTCIALNPPLSLNQQKHSGHEPQKYRKANRSLPDLPAFNLGPGRINSTH
jgi:hypothetical protein